ncbi:hypothetical protein HYX14_04115 [Candidatus Woesearchaeota archaeon]|nr:hypothetical protein [Candidatus Woesearchaeota archaeon]
MTRKARPDLEEAMKGKVLPLLEETMEKHWGVSIPKIETDISDRLKQPLLNMYIPLPASFENAKKIFRKQFLHQELRLHRGNVSELAKVLGIDRRSVHRSMKEMDLARNQIQALEPAKYLQDTVDHAIRDTLEQYKSLLQPEKLEMMYEEIGPLSRNIAQYLPLPKLSWKEAEEEFERQFLSQVLKEHQNKVLNAAKAMGLRPETLSRKIKKLGLRTLNLSDRKVKEPL